MKDKYIFNTVFFGIALFGIITTIIGLFKGEVYIDFFILGLFGAIAGYIYTAEKSKENIKNEQRKNISNN